MTLSTAFRAFISESRRLRGSRPTARLERWQLFSASARHLTLVHAPVIASGVRRLQQEHLSDVTEFDLFRTLGIEGKENRYTDGLAWLLEPGEVGERLARAMLAVVVPAIPSPAGQLIRVTREVWTTDGRVDLVLEFTEVAVAVEVKVWSAEHDTPDAHPQTVAYPAAIEARLAARGRSKPAVCVLLTPEGRAPASAEAGRLSFVTAGATILDHGLEGRAAIERGVARLVGVHLLQLGALSRGGSLARLLADQVPEQPDETWLLRHLRDLLSVGDIVDTAAENRR